jgi:hypothetical protein
MVPTQRMGPPWTPPRGGAAPEEPQGPSLGQTLPKPLISLT